MVQQPHYDPVAEVLQRLHGQGLQSKGREQWEAFCPAHDDRKKRSLSISRGNDGRALLHCHAGCDKEIDILPALGMTMPELFPQSERQREQTSSHRMPGDDKYASIYDYYDAKGELFMQVCRLPNKDFRQRALHPDGQWKPTIKGITTRLYHLPEVLNARTQGRHIFYCEGEKDADALRVWGLTATTHPGGAQRWRDHYKESLKDARVILLPDNDKAGRDFAETIPADLFGCARYVKVLWLPGLAEHGDVYDWIMQGGTRQQLIEMAKAAPRWMPPWTPELTYKCKVGDDEYEFGQRCCMHTERRNKEREWVGVAIPIARNVWPLQRYRSEEDGEHGYRFCYLADGEQHFATMPAGAAIEKRAGKAACRELANQGVEIAVGSEHMLAFALGHWARQLEPPMVRLVRSSGWHGKDAYVNGDKIFGAPGWFVDEQSPAIANRTGRKGTLEDWCSQVKQLVTTKGLLAALAQSLAGALIEPLQLHPFILHLWTDSTQGKSTAAYLAASLWGHPDATFKTWNTTSKSPEALAEQLNGACLILDDTSKFDSDPQIMANTIHALCSPIGRSSLGKNLAVNKQRRWRNTIVSTGEISMRQFLGGFFQGGHRVRALDVRCEPGELACNAKHAETINAFCYDQYGHISDAWIQHLLRPCVLADVANDFAMLRQRAGRMAGTGTEEGRIASQLAVPATALLQARKAALLPWLSDDDIVGLLRWTINAVLAGDGDDDTDDEGQPTVIKQPSTPNERAYYALGQLYHTEPARFPDPNKPNAAHGTVVGWGVRTESKGFDHDEVHIYTRREMLEKSDIFMRTGVGVSQFLKWCLKKGLAQKTKDKVTIGPGRRQRWYIFDTDFDMRFAPKNVDAQFLGADLGAQNTNKNSGVPKTPKTPNF